ncbi:uncharacterized protein [Spinacia oleracea]|uniref:Uncharacterized protein n=1 Tax=Spinacia oleracea TaxID=3562 RepID=A0ABM3RMV4_SPIOL|nr:uncharacterized protein LOC130470579 [Spinacia oleracea]
MACKRATPVVWMLVAAAVAMVVAQNGRMCSAFDMDEAKETMMAKAGEAKETASTWTSWAYTKLSGSNKISVNPEDMRLKQPPNDDDDATPFVSGKVHAVSHAVKDNTDEFYAAAKRDVGAAYDSMASKSVREG